MATATTGSRSDVKRRVGLGFSALAARVMLGIRYDSEQGRAFARQVSEAMRDQACYHRSSGQRKGAFPCLMQKNILSGNFARRLPKACGMR
jgi:ribonucleoside-diphosphate reductase alpha chain